jgi:hypothetical protein
MNTIEIVDTRWQTVTDAHTKNAHTKKEASRQRVNTFFYCADRQRVHVTDAPSSIVPSPGGL